MLSTRLYMLQRLSALVMLPLVVGHLATMIYAIQGGLSAAEILGRTQGSVAWFLFYGLFVLAVAVHGAIGLRVIVSEWTSLTSRHGLRFLTGLVFAVLLICGMTAVFAVTVA